MDKGKKSQFAGIEEAILARWADEKTFEKSVAGREGAPHFEFYDGPPFANGLPHFGHSLVTSIKDAMLRYKTMRGYHVPRRNGWDCHGLPVEFAIEKQFKVSGKKQILELGLEKFNAACRDSIFKYKADWEEFMKRIGRWSDYDNYYATVDRDYTESVWWILSQINEKGLLYRGFKSLPYCPRCETPLSNFELNEGYRDNVPDPSVFVTFPLVDEPDTKLLAWTTTPWTLPANAALAVDPDADYAYVELKSDRSKLILAASRLEELSLRKTDYSLLKTVKGGELVGKKYLPLYPLVEGQSDSSQTDKVHRVYADENVSLEDGTGILHVAPRYGETDLNLGLREGLPLIESVDSTGHMTTDIPGVAGQFFKEADPHITAKLTREGRVFAAETAEHTYPFCWRCDTPLMYFATTTWFVEVSKIREQMLKTAADINWVPGHIKDGRFGKWLEGARDWAISRNRYWGAPLPIWQNVDDEEDYLVVSSIEELKKLAGPDIQVDDLHRPFIDEITFEKDGKTYKRVEEVLDCWFESGSMPVAQWHYPFENKERVESEASLPADFITEAIDQTRLWFYVQHVITTILFNKPAFKNVVVTGFMMAADGQKLSKRLKNYPPVEEVFETEGADALRLYLLSRTQGTETADYMRFDRSAVLDMQRNVLQTLFNSFKFFDTYSKLDNWQATGLDRPEATHLMDQWILARLDETIAASTKSADQYKIAHGVLPIFTLVDDLSNWYIRRSRKRFWKSENDGDKQLAYATLHYSLMRVSQILAPWAPFMADFLWRQLTGLQGRTLQQGATLQVPESVHLSDWPSVKEPSNTSRLILDEMSKVRDAVITEGLSQRAQAGLKVRQPLAKASVHLESERQGDFGEIIREELNVKEVEWINSGPAVKVLTEVTPELKAEGLARDLIRCVQTARKKAGFNVEDRIKLKIASESAEITGAAAKFKDMLWSETLTTDELSEEPEYIETAKIEGVEVEIKLARKEKN